MTTQENNFKNSVSAIIFDVDGVLVDTVPFHFRAWQKTFVEEGIPFEKSDYQRINGIPRDAGISIILQTKDTGRIREVGNRKQHYYLEFLDTTPPRPLPGVLSFLTQARVAGLRIAAASSSKNAAPVLIAAGLMKYFDVIITGNDFKKSKPDPEIFLRAANELGVAPHDAAVVEDAVNGISAAKAGNFCSVAVANSESPDDLRAAGATIVISTTNELTLDLFKHLRVS
ncbi:MAG: beta-phosphoglucomutase family hydrolase [bacterium]|nr:beta-phosphoglucomutase family hydrolase [bacterium]MDZ4285770.1 beta-phosphoglucomutase family hydrolase [Candidatus Sungbacteria bacterium]